MNLQNMKKSETTEQIILFNWTKTIEHILPELKLMYHVPNEGKRKNGAVLKAMGMKSGVPDVVLPVVKNGFPGLYIEMKFKNNKTTPEQAAFMTALRQQGYQTAVCYSAEEAKEEILNYLQEPDKMPLDKCLSAPWILGKCDGVLMAGQMFTNVACRNCNRHTWTKAEATLEANLTEVEEEFKRPIITGIANLSEGKGTEYLPPEVTLETINKTLAFLVKINQITINQSAAVLTVAMNAYNCGLKIREKFRSEHSSLSKYTTK